jgi:hypothetical protein
MRSIVAAAVALAVFVGCGSGGSSASSPEPAVRRPSSTARLAIAEPSPGAVIEGAAVHVRLDLTGARIVQQTSSDLKPDEGHVHVSIDGTLVSMTFSLEQDVPGLPAGSHLLQAEFVASDHAPFNPRVIATSTFTLE